MALGYVLLRVGMSERREAALWHAAAARTLCAVTAMYGTIALWKVLVAKLAPKPFRVIKSRLQMNKTLTNFTRYA